MPDKSVPQPIGLPDPIGALNKRIQRANRKGLVDLIIEEELAKPVTLNEMKTLGFSQDTIRLLERLSGLDEGPLDSSVLDD